MPVLVGLLTLPTVQDQEDLQKIYLDAPHDLLPPYASAEDLIHDALTNETLWVGRFNDRLQGAARLERGVAVWHLSHLCVRKPTRRRGVAERIVSMAQKLAGEAGCELRLQATAGRPEVLALAAKLSVPLDAATP
ncbi:GNAT family N-acetyltransferase [Pseudomonas floridensis]|uniref:GNAT family N-acetyltransferase n=1 Tax=Pseudomonas floridensis TaxID=1958950 RepID=A0A1X0MYY9_9PSED|nr:acetyl-CoA sensor PanZ family protein [Pseudomonas floridensis]ORC55089.1 GNAT family N-acetyltransferase [Pseudomonas floridensis]